MNGYPVAYRSSANIAGRATSGFQPLASGGRALSSAARLAARTPLGRVAASAAARPLVTAAGARLAAALGMAVSPGLLPVAATGIAAIGLISLGYDIAQVLMRIFQAARPWSVNIPGYSWARDCAPDINYPVPSGLNPGGSCNYPFAQVPINWDAPPAAINVIGPSATGIGAPFKSFAVYGRNFPYDGNNVPGTFTPARPASSRTTQWPFDAPPGAEYIPAASPQLQPINVPWPFPRPWPVHYGYPRPRRYNLPNFAPGERPEIGPLPQPEPSAPGDPFNPTDPVWVARPSRLPNHEWQFEINSRNRFRRNPEPNGRPGLHRLRKPTGRTFERKVSARLGRRVAFIANIFTESKDMVECLYGALPNRDKLPQRKGEKIRVWDKAAHWFLWVTSDVVTDAEVSAHIAKAVACVIANEVQDAAIGYVGRQSAKASQNLTRVPGIQFGQGQLRYWSRGAMNQFPAT